MYTLIIAVPVLFSNSIESIVHFFIIAILSTIKRDKTTKKGFNLIQNKNKVQQKRIQLMSKIMNKKNIRKSIKCLHFFLSTRVYDVLETCSREAFVCIGLNICLSFAVCFENSTAIDVGTHCISLTPTVTNERSEQQQNTKGREGIEPKEYTPFIFYSEKLLFLFRVEN